MSHTQRLHFIFAALVAAFPLQEAAAQQSSTDAQWGLGLAAAVDRKPYLGIDTETRALPLVMYENRYVSILGLGVDVKLPPAGPVSFSLRARYAQDGYEADDAPILSGMAERKASFWLGGAATWRTSVANVSAEWLAASGNSKGQKVKLALERSFRTGDWTVTPRLAAHWLDRKYVDYYYGVQAAEARAGRPAYTGDATTNLEFSVRVNYALAPKQSVFVDLSAVGLGSAITDSPLVERSSQPGLRLGYLYRF